MLEKLLEVEQCSEKRVNSGCPAPVVVVQRQTDELQNGTIPHRIVLREVPASKRSLAKNPCSNTHCRLSRCRSREGKHGPVARVHSRSSFGPHQGRGSRVCDQRAVLEGDGVGGCWSEAVALATELSAVCEGINNTIELQDIKALHWIHDCFRKGATPALGEVAVEVREGAKN